jgi:hypothetical protein
MLHGNELPLRHLFSHFDGRTSGPRCFTGPIGKLLQNCESQPIVEFDPIPAPVINIDIADLSSDQKYMLEIYLAVSRGTVSEDLAKKTPGCLNHARWLTMANRLLRVYVSSEDPSNSLKIIANFVMLVYIPMWFAIKYNPTVSSGSRHLFKTVSLMKEQPEEVQAIVHPENIILSMITDDKPFIRELAWRKIKKARGANESSDTVREFKLPKINKECTEYYNLICWQSTNITEPPSTMTVSDLDLQQFIEDKHFFDIKKYPLHTQAVERAIKVVSEASAKVCGQESREGYIQNILASRDRMKVFDSKKDYVKQ